MMLRRSILELSSRRSVGKISPRITSQIPLYLSFRKEYSVASKGSGGSTGKPPDPGSNLSKVFIGGIALGAATITAYQTGYIDKLIVKEEAQQSKIVNEDLHNGETVEQVAVENVEDSKISSPTVENVEDSEISSPTVENVEDSEISSPTVEHGEKNVDIDPYYSKREEHQSEIKQLPILKPHDSISDHNISTSDKENIDSIATNQEDVVTDVTEHDEGVEITSIPTEVAPVIEKNVIKSEQLDSTNMPESIVSNEPNSLLDAYLINDNPTSSSSLDKQVAEAVKNTDDVFVSKEEKIVLDFLQAIHTAEKRQADFDQHIFSQEKRLMKENYEKELKDAKARELMYAERETILDKELHKEKLKAAAALKSLQEKLEEEFRMEIERKESETELELKRLKALAKAELIAAIASEKASQIEKMEEANLNINALCMAFYARSEEARQNHSVHKLALGALALEDALSKGLPIQKEINALNSYIDGIDNDSLLGLVMASLPDDTLKNGTDTILQLNHKFDGLKGTLRHLSLMPPAGGGILVHSLAYIASVLKVKERDISGDGIESLMNRVESFLADGKLLEAAETLEHGLKGSQAAQVVVDWVQQARNRAITEQALTLLQSYATSISHT